MYARTLLSALALAMSAAAVPTAAVAPTAAVPVHPNVFEVYDPAITAPKEGDVWTAGATQTVSWDAAQIGDDGKNTTAMLLLGHQIPGDDSEYLDLKHPLAKDFPVDAGSVSFTVPDVMSADNYIVVLVGSVSDSGNASPVFSIQNAARPDLFSMLAPSAGVPTASAASSSVLTSLPAAQTASASAA